MMNQSANFFVKPGAHERIETVVRLTPDERPALLGTVLDNGQRPVEAALVTIYRSGGAESADQPVGSLYTDPLGRFAFGPLEPGHLYQVQVFKSSNRVRCLELAED